MKLLKYATVIILVGASLYANSITEQGYNDGRKAMMSDSIMNKAFKEFKKEYESATSNSDRYILREGLKGSVKGTCMRLTYGDLNKDKIKNKEYTYINAFKNGCWSVYSK
jgi:hypothetical protein